MVMQGVTGRTTSDEIGDVARRARSCLKAGDPPILWVETALHHRDSGDGTNARAILREIIDHVPSTEAAYFELAFLHRLSGEHREAIRVLRAAVQRVPKSARVIRFLGHMLHAVGAHAKASAVLGEIRPSSLQEEEELDAMFGFGQYLAHFPLGSAETLRDEIVDRYGWMDTATVADRIGAAIRDRAPFAMVRLGDGEGGMLRFQSDEEALYRALYTRNRNELISMWFGREFDWRRNGFLDVASTILDQTRECDVLGVPYEGWLQHEYRISSLRGVPSLVNIYRAILEMEAPTPVAVCSQVVHLNLYLEGHLAPLIKAAQRISVITCISHLPTLLKTQFSLEEVILYQIPGEQGSKLVLGEAATSGHHFPTVFQRLQMELARPHNGRLFLVAAGLLGKFYAATIRHHGGIALDVGSLVDGWMGFRTRPGYDSRLKLTPA